MTFKKFQLVIFLIVILIIPNTVQAGEIVWDDQILAGDHYEWTYEKYEIGVYNRNININISKGSTVIIDIIQDLSSFTTSNTTCNSTNCLVDQINGSILSLYIQMKVDNQLVDNSSLAILFPLFIHPVTFIDTNGEVTEILSSNSNVRIEENEYVYEEFHNMPDSQVNKTIRWQKSGIMNYYNSKVSFFGGPSHITIKRVGYSSRNSDLGNFDGFILIMMSITFQIIIKYHNLGSNKGTKSSDFQ